MPYASSDSISQHYALPIYPGGSVWGYVHDTALPNFNVTYKYADTSSLRVNIGSAVGSVVGMYDNVVNKNLVGYGQMYSVNIGHVYLSRIQGLRYVIVQNDA